MIDQLALIGLDHFNRDMDTTKGLQSDSFQKLLALKFQPLRTKLLIATIGSICCRLIGRLCILNEENQLQQVGNVAKATLLSEYL